MERTVSVLGSTGSIGRQSLQVVDRLGWRVTALTANRNAALIETQIRKYRPPLAVLQDPAAAADLRVRVADVGTKVYSGADALCAAAADASETVITAVVGTTGLLPTMAAIRTGKRIALANKETLVCAGRLVMTAAEQYGAEILPVDSEHSAIFQCLMGNEGRQIKRILLTASGGPFRGWSRAQMQAVTKEMALRHPNWSMGPKITVDSATMMNKGLELIEAMHLFAVRPEQIRVLVHPQSIVHSMVEFADNAVMAQLGTPDMRLPIQLALTYPERVPSPAAALELAGAALTFEDPDPDAFPALPLARAAAARQDAACAVLNAANEEAVGLFLEEKIPFPAIAEYAADAVERLGSEPASSIEEILAADRAARRFVRERA